MDTDNNENNNNVTEETPEYVDPSETIHEVEINKENGIVMDDDDDDDDGDDGMMQEDDDEMGEEDEDFVDESIQGFFHHKDAVYGVAINPANENIVASGGGDDTAYIWNRTTGEKLHQLTGHKDSIAMVKFNFDGRLLATGGMDGYVKIWDVATGQLHVTLEGPAEAVEWIQWHPRGNVLVAGSADCCAFMWVTMKGDLMGTFAGHRGAVTCGSFTPDGKLVVTGSEDGTVKIWSPKDSSHIATIQGTHTFHEQMITAMDIRKDSVLVCTVGQDSFACLSNINTGKCIGKLIGHTDSIQAVAFSNVNNFVITGSSDGTARIWDTSMLQTRAICRHKEGSSVSKVVVHPTQPIFYTASTDRTVCIWDERNGQMLRQFRGHQDSILDIDITADGSIIVTAADDKVCLVFSPLAHQDSNNNTNNTNNTNTTTTTTTTTTM